MAQSSAVSTAPRQETSSAVIQAALHEPNSVAGPDGRLGVSVACAGGRPTYSVIYDGTVFVEPSPLGLRTDIADLGSGLELVGMAVDTVEDDYSIRNIKRSEVHYRATRAVYTFNKDGRPAMDVIFQISANDVAFKYKIYPRHKNTKVCRVDEELTGLVWPEGTTTFICPQMPPMSGWMRTAPSYETYYEAEARPGSNGEGYGYSFPCLFHLGERGWALVSETGVDGMGAACRLVGNPDGSYTYALPSQDEYNGNGTAALGLSCPGETAWRTITVGTDLAPIAETTVPWDVVRPLYAPKADYCGSRGSWSWIIKGDKSINFDTQKEYIDLSAAMGWETVLVDNWWDTQIGREGMEELAAYGASKGVRLMIWYNSNGYWNDAPQGPRDIMNRGVKRRAEMAWLKKIGAKGIKVDFLGSDKQQTLQLYEDILADANDFGLMVIFHGCTLPRGWERMYPNFAGAEAVRASENLNFNQSDCDAEAFNACLHPFIRNSVASMDFGGSALNRIYNSRNDLSRKGSIRRTSDVFALATAVLFQSGVQHFALAPNNLTDAPLWALDFMREVPTTWDDTRFIDGYPGRYVVMARRCGDHWYIAGIAAEGQTLKLDLPMLQIGSYTIYSDDSALRGSVTQAVHKAKPLKVTIPANGAFLIVQ